MNPFVLCIGESMFNELMNQFIPSGIIDTVYSGDRMLQSASQIHSIHLKGIIFSVGTENWQLNGMFSTSGFNHFVLHVDRAYLAREKAKADADFYTSEKTAIANQVWNYLMSMDNCESTNSNVVLPYKC